MIKAIWRNLLSVQNEAITLFAMCSKKLWLVGENHAAVKLDSNGFYRIKTYSKSRIELRNPLEKCRKHSPVVCVINYTLNSLSLFWLAENVKSAPVTSSSFRLYNNHSKDTQVMGNHVMGNCSLNYCYTRVKHALCCLSSVKKQKDVFHLFSLV